MALHELLRALREQAARRREEEVARADSTVERIRAESRAALARRRGDFISRTRREEDESALRSIARARRAAAERVLTARARMLERVRDAVHARLVDAAQNPEYRASLEPEVRGALNRLPPGPVVLRVGPDLAALLGGLAEARDATRVEETAQVGAGFTVFSSEQGIEVDGTLETRLERAWPRLAVTVLARATK